LRRFRGRFGSVPAPQQSVRLWALQLCLGIGRGCRHSPAALDKDLNRKLAEWKHLKQIFCHLVRAFLRGKMLFLVKWRK
jgi:hypothetical protein